MLINNTRRRTTAIIVGLVGLMLVLALAGSPALARSACHSLENVRSEEIEVFELPEEEARALLGDPPYYEVMVQPPTEEDPTAELRICSLSQDEADELMSNPPVRVTDIDLGFYYYLAHLN